MYIYILYYNPHLGLINLLGGTACLTLYVYVCVYIYIYIYTYIQYTYYSKPYCINSVVL